MDVKESMLHFRLESVSESLKRARLAFLVSTIVSVAVIIVVWNAYLSWDRVHVLREQWATNEITREAQKQLISGWVKNRIISLPLLGIRIGVSDAAPLASFSLLIINIWYFYCVRRDNRLNGRQ